MVHIHISESSSFSESPPQSIQPSYSAYLGEEGSLLSLKLEAIRQQAPHGLGAVAGDFAEVRGQIATAHHKDNLRGRGREMADLGFWAGRLGEFQFSRNSEGSFGGTGDSGYKRSRGLWEF